MVWEVDWTHDGNTGQKVWARNPTSHIRASREWHLTCTGHLRDAGVNTPVYRKDSWEVDWSKRDGKKVWARNPYSKMPDAHEWHWIDHKTLDQAGLHWKPARPVSGRWKTTDGYIHITRRAMTDAEIEAAEQYGLFRGKKKLFVKEHCLVAAIKYGGIPENCVVRHVNGVKDDNRPENLVLGTTQENTMDHDSARIQAIHWRDVAERQIIRIDALEHRVAELERIVSASMLRDPERCANMVKEALG